MAAKRTYPMPTTCPVSGSRLLVTRLESPTSGVVIEGQFEPNEFASLRDERLEILRLFVKVRGNLKEIERILGLSYPTVRQRFEDVLKALGYEHETPEQPVLRTRNDILTALEAGQIGAEEAARLLREL